MSYAEDMGHDGWDIPEYVDNENNWKNGYHYDKFNNCHTVSEMSNSYLLNTIRFFKGWNTKPLLKEAKKRGLKITA